MASGGYTENGVLQIIIGTTTMGDHLHGKFTIPKDPMQSGQSSKGFLAFGIICKDGFARVARICQDQPNDRLPNGCRPIIKSAPSRDLLTGAASNVIGAKDS